MRHKSDCTPSPNCPTACRATLYSSWPWSWRRSRQRQADEQRVPVRLLEEGYSHLKQAKKLFADGQQKLKDKRTQEGYDMCQSAKQQTTMAGEKFRQQGLEDVKSLTESQESVTNNLTEAWIVKLAMFSGGFIASALFNTVRITGLVATVAGLGVAATSVGTVSEFANTTPWASTRVWFLLYIVLAGSVDAMTTLRGMEDVSIWSIDNITGRAADTMLGQQTADNDEIIKAIRELDNLSEELQSSTQAVYKERQRPDGKSTKEDKQP